jgi:hypothetical protein
MSPDGIVEAVDIASDFGCRFSPAPEDGAPNGCGAKSPWGRGDPEESRSRSCGEHGIPDFGHPAFFDAKCSEFELTFF